MRASLSVIIAAYNAEDTLGEQLEALSSQSADVFWEVVVCDNRSTDRTAEIAAGFADRLLIRVVPAPDRPSGAYARTVGVAVSTSDWLAFVDADDVVAPGWLAAMVRGLAEHQFVAGRLDATVLNSPTVYTSRPVPQDKGLQDGLVGPRLPHAGGGNLGIHRRVYDRAGGFTDDIPGLPDVDFCWRVQLAGVPLVFLPDATLYVRLRASRRAMWSQGHTYGAGHAMLEHRYGGLTRDDVPEQVRRTLVDGGTTTYRRGSGLVELARHVTDPGRFVWQLAWHVGYRRTRRFPSAPALARAVRVLSP